MQNEQFNLELFFKALADHTRLRLIHLLADDEVCVCSLVDSLETKQSKISRHLAYLRRAGLVAVRRNGRWAYYRLVEPTDPCAARIFRELREHLANTTEQQHPNSQIQE
ncbi:MAG TPA: metalloregulator ArsR/SmtB family transcription factor [Pyrinomonadaceae bacterium]|nr:metalloregulator ArsR/SmtB family transcription factor [Pyrinomonadaceae bacterium]